MVVDKVRCGGQTVIEINIGHGLFKMTLYFGARKKDTAFV